MTQQAYTIADVVPHAGRMVLLDELVDYGPEYAVAAVRIRVDSVLCDGVTGVPAWVGLEYMAQTIGTYTGIDDINRGLRPKVGLLLGCRSYRASVPVFAINSRLVIKATLEFLDDNNLAVFSCEIREGDELRASGDIKAYKPDDVHEFLRGLNVG